MLFFFFFNIWDKIRTSILTISLSALYWGQGVLANVVRQEKQMEAYNLEKKKENSLFTLRWCVYIENFMNSSEMLLE